VRVVVGCSVGFDNGRELAFTNIIYNLPIKNEEVRRRREELGEFIFESRETAEGLVLANEEPEDNGGRYYGYM
jgi:hypothetical protein